MSVLVTPVETPVVVASRPSAARRTLVAVTGVLACALPVVFAVSLTRMLVVGDLPEHRFHQLTGQGLLLVALWLGGLVPQLRAGWRGRAAGPAVLLLHVAFVATGVACTVAAPLGGAPFLLGVVVVTGLLLQAALPRRPRLRDLDLVVRPAGLTVSLVLAAVASPYVVEQLTLQHAATGHHAANPHFFDMAWFVSALVVLALVSNVVVQARSLLAVAVAGLLLTGTAMVVLDQDTPTGAGFAALGLALVVSRAVEDRRGGGAPQATTSPRD